MVPHERSPLEQSREDALRFLYLMFVFGAMPVAILIVVYTWIVGQSDIATQSILLYIPPLLLAIAFAVLLRPSPNRSTILRGRIAIGVMSIVSVWGLLLNGPRAGNAVGLSVLLVLTVMFYDSNRVRWGVLAATGCVWLTGLLLRRIHVLPIPPEIGGLGTIYDVASGILMILGVAYCTQLFWATLQNYRYAQQALNAKSLELLAAQSESQELLRQEMLARLATSLAGQVAGELDTVSKAWRRASEVERDATGVAAGDAPMLGKESLARLRETGTRATQTLRLLESLGRPTIVAAEGTDLAGVLRRVEDTIRPIMPYGRTLEIQCSTATRPLIDGERLEQIIVYLALQLKQRYPAGLGLIIRVYEGLGDVSRSDGRRTWTIIDVGRLVHHDPESPSPTSQDNDAVLAGGRLLGMALSSIGGRLELETRDGGDVFYVLQLPSC